MTRVKKYPSQWDKDTILLIFRDLDHYFSVKSEKTEILTLGGVSVVLQGYQDRSTNDIDLAPTGDAPQFLQACETFHIPAQTITLASTVDFNNIAVVTVFEGNFLKVLSVTAHDLIKLKLERFRKQDPEDIYAIIEKTGITYLQFCDLVSEGKDYFIGRVSEYLLSARIVVEQIFSTHLKNFDERFSLVRR